MFFVGASAHMFIYLLIPAFFVVCCYLKGTVGSVGDLLSINVVHEQRSIKYSSDTYVYKEVKKKKTQKKNVIPIESITDDSFTSYQCSFCPSPIILSAALRAPPLSFI